MITFEVKDMTCGHCVSSITRAVQSIDRDAQVQVDLATHRVRIESTRSDASQLGDAIQLAGYTPLPVGDAASLPERSAPRSGGCCR